MKNEIYINEENFSRGKKLLKKSLEKENIKVTLSKSANILANSFGFQDEHEIQKYFKIKDDSCLENDNEEKLLSQ